jgi:hypothetical protein
LPTAWGEPSAQFGFFKNLNLCADGKEDLKIRQFVTVTFFL